MIKERKINRQFIMYSIVVISWLMIFMICIFLRWNESRVRYITFDKENVVQGFKVHIDEKTYKQGWFTMSGWIVRPGEAINTAEQYIVLKDVDSDKCIQLPTQVVGNAGVTNTIADGNNYDMSGFYSQAYIPQCKKGKWKIYVLYKSNGNNCLVSLKKSIKGEGKK